MREHKSRIWNLNSVTKTRTDTCAEGRDEIVHFAMCAICRLKIFSHSDDQNKPYRSVQTQDDTSGSHWKGLKQELTTMELRQCCE